MSSFALVKTVLITTSPIYSIGVYRAFQGDTTYKNAIAVSLISSLGGMIINNMTPDVSPYLDPVLRGGLIGATACTVILVNGMAQNSYNDWPELKAVAKGLFKLTVIGAIFHTVVCWGMSTP